MRIKLLSSAMEDLYEGRLFYERQGEGLGEYFFDSLFSTPSTTGLKRNLSQWFGECSICVETPGRSAGP